MKKYLIFALYATIAIFHYTHIFNQTMGDRPIGNDDTYLSMLNNPVKESYMGNLIYKKDFEGFNVRDSDPTVFYKNKGTRYPIVHQNRHTGLTLFFVKLIYDKVDNPIQMILSISKITTILYILIFGFILFRYYSLSHAFWGMLFIAMDPVQIVDHNLLISEHFNKLFLIFAFLFHHMKNKRPVLIGIILGLGLLNKMTFLFPVIPFLFIIYKDYSKEQLIKMAVSIAILISPYPFFLFLDTYDLSAMVSLNNNPVIRMPFAAFSAVLSNKILFHRVFFFDFDLTAVTGFGSLRDYAVSATGFFMLYIMIYKNKRDYRVLSVFIYLILLFFLGFSLSIKSYYLVDISFFYTLLFTIGMTKVTGKIKGTIFKLMVLLSLGYTLSSWYTMYVMHGISTSYDIKRYKQVLSEITTDENLYVTGFSQSYIYEFLSKERIRPTHLQSGYNSPSFRETLSFLKDNSTIITETYDPISHAFGVDKFTIQEMKDSAPDYEFFDEKIYYHRGHRPIWKFSFRLK